MSKLKCDIYAVLFLLLLWALVILNHLDDRSSIIQPVVATYFIWSVAVLGVNGIAKSQSVLLFHKCFITMILFFLSMPLLLLLISIVLTIVLTIFTDDNITVKLE